MLSLRELSMAELNTLAPFYVPSTGKRRYDAVVKLIGVICNQACIYCFYLCKKIGWQHQQVSDVQRKTSAQ
jgi:sulfatase maturation enzyme AslB (radical SAM superfamily)